MFAQQYHAVADERLEELRDNVVQIQLLEMQLFE